MGLKYKRVLLKLSGEALAGEKKTGIDNETVLDICKNIKECLKLGAQIAIVCGGGNFWRGRTSENMDRCTADQIGMLATTMNALAISDGLNQCGIETVIQSAIEMPYFADVFNKTLALKALNEGKVVIFCCGTGHPYFSTDTATSLRAIEIEADVILMAKMVDGVYDKDPKKASDAKRYDSISYSEILEKNLAVVDSTSASLCRDNNMPSFIFSLQDPKNIIKSIKGENIGTVIKEDK